MRSIIARISFWIHAVGAAVLVQVHGAGVFEGQILAAGGRADAMSGLRYTVGTNSMRVEMTDTNFPNVIDVVDLASGEITLIQPMNRTFVRFKPGVRRAPFPGMMRGGLPPGAGPQGQSMVPPGATPPPPPMQPPAMPAGIGPTNFPGMPHPPAVPDHPQPGGLPPGVGPQPHPWVSPGGPAMPVVPAMPQSPAMGGMPMTAMVPPDRGLELTVTDDTTNLLNYPCRRYLIKRPGETMEVWATDQLAPFQAYLPIQPSPFGPAIMELRWSDLLGPRKLFPLRGVLRADNGVERYCFEVQSVVPDRLTKAQAQAMQPPEGYLEVQPMPF